MKKIATTFALAMISVAMFAQIDFNLFIRDIGNYSRNYTDDHVIDLYENHYGIPRQTLMQIFGGFGYDWGNVTLGLEMSYLLEVPLGDLMGIYREHPRGNGWGVIAQRYGIKPGSPEFHRMKAMMSRKNGYWREIFIDYGKNSNPAIARRDRYIFNDDLYRFDFPSSKEMKKINKEIEKRNRKIMKQQEKTMKAWEKEEKKIRKEQKKWTKKGN